MFVIKKREIVTVNTHNIVQDLAKLYIKPHNVNEIIETVLYHVRISMSHQVSFWTASQIYLDGGVIANMKIASAMQESTNVWSINTLI